MNKYVYAFHGGSMPETEQERADVMAQWGAWMQGLGSAISYDGGPVGPSSTVSASGVAADGGANPLSGIMVVQASSMESAIEMAQGCPIHSAGGSVEVAEVLQM